MCILKHDLKEPSSVTFATQVLPKKVNLNEHIESVHEGKKPFKCNVCDAGSSVHKRRKLFKTHCWDRDLNDQKTRQNF